MYAVIETGGKQYRVAPGDVIDVERLEQPDKGAVEFDRVLLVGGEKGVQVGTPTVDGARVKAELVEQTRGPKIRVFKMKRRKNYRRLRGHRQEVSRVRIQAIEG